MKRLLIFLNKYFYNDYSDFFIEKEDILNPCGELIESIFRLKIARYRFGRKSYFYFYEWSCGMGDCCKSTISSISEENLITKYKKFGAVNNISSYIPNICNKLPLEDYSSPKIKTMFPEKMKIILIEVHGLMENVKT